MPTSERGSVLVVVVGLAAALLALSLAYMARMRGDAREGQLLLAEAQARIMLNAALMYLQETSRIGWYDPATGAAEGGECYGWTDIRDGSLGPRGPRPASPGAALPVPAWWRGGWPSYPDLPAPAQRRWPCPGAATRADMHAMRRPPGAVQLTAAANPVPWPVPRDHPQWEEPWHKDPNVGANITTYWKPAAAAALAAPGAMGMLDPQPVAETWGEFIAGDPAPLPASENLAWFRVYRETRADHDADGEPFFDTVALADPAAGIDNWSVFIVACGSGATRGYRFWDLPANDPRRALEPVTASESGLFPGEDVFQELRAQERILWYRVEWSPLQGGSFDASDTYSQGVSDDLTTTYDRNRNLISSVAGNFRWIQRLDREPPSW